MTYGSQMDKPKQNNKTLKRAEKQRPVEEVSVPPVEKGETVVLSTPQGREPCGQTKFCIREEFRGAQLGDKRLTGGVPNLVEGLSRWLVRLCGLQFGFLRPQGFDEGLDLRMSAHSPE